MTPRLLASAALVTALPGLAAAQDTFALNYGVAITSNYNSDGVTQTDDGPAVQPYVEGSYGMFYGGVWASNVDFGEGDPDNWEFDLYAGIRRTFGLVDFDLNYTRYLYDSSGDCCGEIIMVLGYPLDELGAIGGEFKWDPETETVWAELAGGVTFAEVWEVGGVVGTDFGTRDFGEHDRVAWDLGITRGLGDYASLDLRYYDSNYDDATGVVTISFDF
jgi:uncharacterized protein (TIGR02001 family)